MGADSNSNKKISHLPCKKPTYDSSRIAVTINFSMLTLSDNPSLQCVTNLRNVQLKGIESEINTFC